MEKAKEKPPEFYKSVKTSLKSILKHPEINSAIINNAVIKSNKIVIHTLQFLKLYLLDYYENNNGSLPVISKELINNTMKVVCGEKEEKRGKPPKQETVLMKDKLTAFYKEHYLPTTQNDPIDYAGLNTVLDYLKEDVITMYENNIQLHYVEYIERYVNVVWKKKMIMDLTSKKFEHIHFPHILFFGLAQRLKLKDRILVYKGGEDGDLIVGKEYVIEEKNYSPNKKTARVAV